MAQKNPTNVKLPSRTKSAPIKKMGQEPGTKYGQKSGTKGSSK